MNTARVGPGVAVGLPDWPILVIALILVIDLGWGLLLAFRIPPFGGLDEAYHWLRIDQISFGELLARTLGPNNWGGTFDARGVQLIGYFGGCWARHQLPDWHAAHALARHLQKVPRATFIGSFPSTASFAPLAYLPNATGVALARACGLDLLAQLHAGRIAGVVCYVAMSGLVVRLLPAGRLAVLSVLSMPGALAQAATLDADPLNTVLPALLAAWCLRLRLRPTAQFGLRPRTGLVSLVTGIGLLKLTAVVFAGLTLLIPRERFGGAPTRWMFVAVCLAACAGVALLWNLAYPFVPGMYWHTGADPKAALNVLAARPLHHLTTSLAAGFSNLPGLWQGAYGRIGGQASQNGIAAPAHLAWLGLAATLGLALSDRRGRAWPRAAAVVAICAIANVAILDLAFRIAFNPPNVEEPWGIQGRYLVSAALLLALGLALSLPWRGSETWRVALTATATATSIAVQSVTIMTALVWMWPAWHR